MAFCRDCGKEVQDDWATCPFCSSTLPTTSVNDSVVMGDIKTIISAPLPQVILTEEEGQELEEPKRIEEAKDSERFVEEQKPIQQEEKMKDKIWDDKKGKYVKPFTGKRIELLPHLYVEGRKIYWDIPKPKPTITKEEADLVHNKRINNTDDDISDIIVRIHLGKLKWIAYNYQKQMNVILRLLPYTLLCGFLLGFII